MADHARLGAEIRSARVARGLSLRAMARVVGLSPSTLSLAERGGPVIGLAAIDRLAGYLAGDGMVTRDRWRALSGRLAPDLEALLLASPERWDEVRALLGSVDGWMAP